LIIMGIMGMGLVVILLGLFAGFGFGLVSCFHVGWGSC
jgi:hypothetical protein